VRRHEFVLTHFDRLGWSRPSPPFDRRDPGLNVSDISESDRVGSCVDALLQPSQVGLERSERLALCVRVVLSVFAAAWPSDFDFHDVALFLPLLCGAS